MAHPLLPRRSVNKLQPHSVNPRQGSLSPRLRRQKQLNPWVLYLGLPLIGLVALLGLGWYITTQHLTTIQQVTIELNGNPELLQITPATLTEQTNYLKGRSLLQVNQQDLERDLLSHNPALADVFVMKQYPHQLTIVAVGQVAMAQITDDANQDGSYLVNRQGFLFAQDSQPDLPTIISSQQHLKVGDNLSAQDLQLGLALIQGLPVQAESTKIILHPSYLEVIMTNQPKILVASDKSADIVIKQITDLLQQSPKPQQIDLRFDRPVLAY